MRFELGFSTFLLASSLEKFWHECFRNVTLYIRVQLYFVLVGYAKVNTMKVKKEKKDSRGLFSARQD